MKKQKTKYVGWYYATTIDDFQGFMFNENADEITFPLSGFDWCGPYPTLAAAKKAAVAYHTTTIRYARRAIADIRKWESWESKSRYVDFPERQQP